MHEAIKQRLLARRAELANRASRTSEDLRHERDPLVQDFSDQATQRNNEDVLRGIGDSARQQLQLVNRALARLESGDYFHCASCGASIPAERLAAIPEAELCTTCAQQAA
jgi:RNA polymerase-binding protein DksA